MSDIFDLPRDSDGFLNMDAFPDDDLDPIASSQLDGTLQDAPEPDDFDHRWDSLLDRAVDPDAPEVSHDLIGSGDPDMSDDPFADVGDSGMLHPFADLDDDQTFEGVGDGPDDQGADDDASSFDDDEDDDDFGDPTLDDRDLEDQPLGDVVAAHDHLLVFEDDDGGTGFDDQVDLSDSDGLDEPGEYDDTDGLDALDSQLKNHGY